MNFSIEISCDISGVSNGYSGETVVARYGHKIEVENRKINKEINTVIRRICSNKEINLIYNLYSIYEYKGNIVLTKKTNLKPAISGAACSQVTISLPKKYNIVDFIMSKIGGDLLFGVLDYHGYIKYYTKNGRVEPILIEENSLSKCTSFPDVVPTSIFLSNIYDNIYASVENFPLYSLLYMSSKFDNNEKNNSVSLLTGDIAFKNVSDLVSIFRLNKIQINMKKIENALPKNQLCYFNNMNKREIEDLLYTINKSIDSNTGIVDSLSSLIEKRKTILSHKSEKNKNMDAMIDNSISSINKLIKIQSSLIDALIKNSKSGKSEFLSRSPHTTPHAAPQGAVH